MLRQSLLILAMLTMSFAVPAASATTGDDCASGQDAGPNAATGVYLTIPIQCDATFLGYSDEDVYLVNLTAGQGISVHALDGMVILAPDGSEYSSSEHIIVEQTGTWTLYTRSFQNDASPRAYEFRVNTQLLERSGSVPLPNLGLSTQATGPLSISTILGPDSPPVDGVWVELPNVSSGHEIASSRNFTSGEEVGNMVYYFFDENQEVLKMCDDGVVCSVPAGASRVYIQPPGNPSDGREYLFLYFH